MSGLSRINNHPEYYLHDGSVSLLTNEHTLFRVHKSFFERESEVFREIFAQAAVDDPESGTDAKPFRLNVTTDELAHFCWVWYDKEYTYQEQTIDRWLTIFQLSTRWGFARMRALAIRELDMLQLSPAERISVYNEHGIESERLVSSYVELCKSPKITQADGNLLEMETLINILQARENAQRQARQLGRESPTSASLEDQELRDIVSQFFKTGLNPLSNGTSTGLGAQASGLNGMPHHATETRTSTIKLGVPQVPDRRTQPSDEVMPHLDSPLEMESPEMGQQERALENREKNPAEAGKEVAKMGQRLLMRTRSQARNN